MPSLENISEHEMGFNSKIGSSKLEGKETNERQETEAHFVDLKSKNWSIT